MLIPTPDVDSERRCRCACENFSGIRGEHGRGHKVNYLLIRRAELASTLPGQPTRSPGARLRVVHDPSPVGV